MHNPTEEHMQAVRRILGYLKTNLGRGLLFRKGREIDVKGFTDADYVGLSLIEDQPQNIVYS